MSPKPFQAAIIAVPIIIFGCLAWQELVPTGVFVQSWEPGQNSAFVDPLRPDQRVEPLVITPSPSQSLIGDPVYTFFHLHRDFDEVDVRVRFKNEGVPIVEAGGLTAPGPDEAYALQPLQNLLIDQSEWPRLDDGTLVLLQRRPVYKSPQDFLKHPPAGGRIAQYQMNAPLPSGARRLLPSLDLDAEKIDFVIAEYQTPAREGEWTVVTVPLYPHDLLLQSRAIKFAFSVPGAGQEGKRVVIRDIRLTYKRAPLVETLRKYLPWL